MLGLAVSNPLELGLFKHTFYLIYFPLSVKNNNIISVLFKLRVTCILTECKAKWVVKLGCRHLHVSLRAEIKEITVVRMEKRERNSQVVGLFWCNSYTLLR